jgi:hypothetical protein
MYCSGVSPSTTNFALSGNSSVTILNGPSESVIATAGTGVIQVGPTTGLTLASTPVSMSSADVTLGGATLLSPIIMVTGTITAAIHLIFPNNEGFFYVDFSGANLASGSVTLRDASSTGAFTVSSATGRTLIPVHVTASSFASG